MIEDSITLDEVIEFLNEFRLIDNKALCSLINNRVECNKDLADHETVQVAKKGDKYYVGFLGILNGLFGVDDETQWGIINVLGKFEPGNEWTKKFTKIINIQRVDFEKVKNNQPQMPIQQKTN